MTSDQAALRILMLHGYRQNEAIFKERTGGLRKKLKTVAQFFYCEAPHEVPKIEETTVENSQQLDQQTITQKGWWLKTSEFEERNLEQDFETTLNYIDQVFEKYGPFDGVWGFSMGGILANMLCKISSDNKSKEINLFKNIKFNFVIIAAASKSYETRHESYYDLNNKFNTPSLHVIGKSDKLVSYEKAIELTQYFINPKIYIHEFGHFIPNNTEAKDFYLEFLKEMQKNKI